MSIESKGYIATPTDITALTKAILAGQSAVASGNGTYLKSLHATTVAELGESPAAHAKTRPRLKAEGVAKQLAALEAVHGRFFEAVVTGASDHLPPGKKERMAELNRRTTFARTSASTLRSYIRAGNDITGLVSARIVKAALAVPRTVKPPNPKRLRTQTEKLSKALMVKLLALSEADKIAAIGELETLMGQLAAQLEDLGVAAVSDPREAAEKHVPLRAKGGRIFVPVTRSQVIRQTARPS